ncbi:MAG: DUF4058 family protein [Gemmataceae bacterium]|nr:DUF4058 family protein [Gemmataceae bacterium]
MPLLDHHHPPVRKLVQWQSFHSAWMTTLAYDMNADLPPRFVAAPSFNLGIEVDVAALERFRDEYNGAAWEPTWTAPSATATLPFAVATDELEVLIHEDYSGEVRLVGAVEFVSPANKDRPDTRDAFVSKCHGYLQKGVGLLIVDVVTDRHANLHNDLMARVGGGAVPVEGHLYATAYHPTGKNGSGELTVWTERLAVGEPLPTMPLWMFGGICIPARLEETYATTRRNLRVDRLLGPPAPAPNPAAG